jgi:hypothetical protein
MDNIKRLHALLGDYDGNSEDEYNAAELSEPEEATPLLNENASICKIER